MWNAPSIGVDADHRQLATGDLDDFVRLEAMCFDADTDLHRSGTGSDGMGVQADSITHEDRLLEFDSLEGDGSPIGVDHAVLLHRNQPGRSATG